MVSQLGKRAKTMTTMTMTLTTCKTTDTPYKYILFEILNIFMYSSLTQLIFIVT